MKKINDYVIENCNGFIDWWNGSITEYGFVTVGDVKDILCDPNNQAMYRDSKFGWTEEITTCNFIATTKRTTYKFYTYYQLNLPEAKEL